MLICNDLDLAMQEPSVLRDCGAMASVVWKGEVSISGTLATVTGPEPVHAPPVAPGMLVYLPATKQTLLFVRKESEDSFSLCALVPEMTNDAFPEDLEDFSGPGDGTFEAQIATFPQLRTASDIVRDALAVRDLGAGQYDVRSTRRAAAFLALAMIFRSMAALDRSFSSSPSGIGHYFNADLREHAKLYQRLYEREIRRVRVWVDADGDGYREATRAVGTVPLARV